MKEPQPSVSLLTICLGVTHEAIVYVGGYSGRPRISFWSGAVVSNEPSIEVEDEHADPSGGFCVFDFCRAEGGLVRVGGSAAGCHRLDRCKCAELGDARIVVVHPPEKKDFNVDSKAQASDDSQPITRIGSGFVVDPSGWSPPTSMSSRTTLAIFVGTPDGGRYRARDRRHAGQSGYRTAAHPPGRPAAIVQFRRQRQTTAGDTVSPSAARSGSTTP